MKHFLQLNAPAERGARRWTLVSMDVLPPCPLVSMDVLPPCPLVSMDVLPPCPLVSMDVLPPCPLVLPPCPLVSMDILPPYPACESPSLTAGLQTAEVRKDRSVTTASEDIQLASAGNTRSSVKNSAILVSSWLALV